MNVTPTLEPPAILESVLKKPARKMLIGGRWTEAASGKTFEVKDPTTGNVITEVPEAGKADVDQAVGAARSLRSLVAGGRLDARRTPLHAAALGRGAKRLGSPDQGRRHHPAASGHCGTDL